MQVSILQGIFTDNGPDVRVSYPVNMVPVPTANGASNGYLRPSDGLVSQGEAPDGGVCRGGIEWLGTIYRVIGTKLLSIDIDGVVLVIGDVGAGDTVSMCYGPSSTTYPQGILAVASGTRLYYYDGSTLTQVTDADLGLCLDVVWIDGYFMTTDGESIVVSDLVDPFAFNPLKYGSAEASPDPIVALLRLRNEVYALGANTIEVFDNIGGVLFPFGRIEGAQVQKGCVGTHACCVYMEQVAFVGSGLNEAPGIYMAANGSTQKISTVEIDRTLSEYTEAELSLVVLEPRNIDSHLLLYVHLPDRAVVFDFAATQAFEAPIWHVLTSSVADFTEYRARHFVWCYNRWNIGDPSSASFGTTTQETSAHYGDIVRWEFGTQMLYNESKGAVVNRLELLALPGRVALGLDPTISTSWSLDGMSWSTDSRIKVGTIGDRARRIAWFHQGAMRSTRMQRFRGTSDAHISFLRLEAAVTPLAY